MLHRLNIPSDPSRINEVADFLESRALALGLKESAVADLVIAGSEAVNNAILHGNQQRTDQSVEIILRKEGEHFLVLEVEDEGHSFSLDSLPDPTSSEHLMDEGGRGWLIIRHLMDDVEVLQSDRGTRVVMKKRR